MNNNRLRESEKFDSNHNISIADSKKGGNQSYFVSGL